MKKSFAARRAPRIIRDDDEGGSQEAKLTNTADLKAGTKKTRPKARSKTVQFDDDGDGNNSDDHNRQDRMQSSTRPRPDRKRGLKPSRSVPVSKPTSDEDDDAAESSRYSHGHVQQLRDSALSSSSGRPAEKQKTVDVAAKFGSDAGFAGPTSLAMAEDAKSTTQILSEAQIQERKERRRRRAAEVREAHDSDDDNTLGGLKTTDDLGDGFVLVDDQMEDEAPGRLEREDEDLAEGFDEFVDDGRVALTRQQEVDWDAKKRAELESLIAGAQQDESSDEDDEHAYLRRPDDDSFGRYGERTSARRYDEAQIRAGNFGPAGSGPRPQCYGTGAMTPPRVEAVPDIADVVARLAGTVAALEADQDARRERVRELDRDLAELDKSEAWVQHQLTKVGDDYSRLQGGEADTADRQDNSGGDRSVSDRMDVDSVSDSDERPDVSRPVSGIPSFGFVSGGKIAATMPSSDEPDS